MARYSYYIDVYNGYLGKHQRVGGRTKREANYKADVLLAQWTQREVRARRRQEIADATAHATFKTDAARAEIDEHRGILGATLDVDDRVPWDELLADRPFTESPPSLGDVNERLNVPPRQSILEAVHLRSRERREAAEADARALLDDELEGFRVRRKRHEQDAAAEREELLSVKGGYEQGEEASTEEYLTLVLMRSRYPETFPQTFDVSFVKAEQLAVASIDVPRIDEIPQVAQFRFNKDRSEFDMTPLSEQQVNDLYDEVVYQTILRTLHEIFEGDYMSGVQEVVVNAMTIVLNPATGLDEETCIATCGAPREVFEGFDLARVRPAACFRALNGLSGPRPSSLRAVQPLRTPTSSGVGDIEIDLGDRGDVPDDLLAIDPFQFEQLIGALFRKIYAAEGAEVDVTQCSGDGGVDVVVQDPDPIKGGKTVIQVKRYRGVIGVGYVRELYGTMLNEGASKGILVGTGHYGSDARAFAAGKPVTLIDGETLLRLLGEQGLRYRIGENAAASPGSTPLSATTDAPAPAI
jgi:restriction system protein